MKAFNKIGFHTSVGGNPSGIGDYLRRLEGEGVPFFIKAADSMTGVFEAQKIMQESEVPHTAVFRRSVRFPDDPTYNPDIPDYDKEPEAAAEEHWKKHRAIIPPELDKEIVWVETINEPRKEVEWADWLGHFAFHTAEMMMADGYKFSAFGYSSGTPDEGAWDTDGMLRYLELCERFPNKASVALHEYSFKTENIWFMRGDLIGRFEKLFRTCDKHKIERPYVLITEWGWTHDDVPKSIDKAMGDIEEVAKYYARFPKILGAAIWYLGPGFGGIANKVQRLIEPVTKFSIETTFDVPDPTKPRVPDLPPPVFPMPPEEPEPTEPDVPTQPNGRFIKDITIPDDSRMTVGETFVKTWRVENSGDVAWGSGFKLVHVDGVPMTAQTTQSLPAAQPGQQVNVSVELTVPEAPGVHFTDWRMHDDQGNPFGDVLFTRIIAEKRAEPAGGSDGRFVADVTIPDDTEIKANTSFVKTWRVRNTGARSWGDGFTLEFVGGMRMENEGPHPLPHAEPGEVVEISVTMETPRTPGTHYADYRMKDDQGVYFGEILYTRIVVPWEPGSSLVESLSQRDPLWADMRLGHAGSNKTIGEWGCLLTCYAMVANALGKDVTPLQLNHAMVSKGGFINQNLTKWNALSDVYTNIVYEGKVQGSAPGLLDRIDASLAEERPVSVQVDFTSDTPYTANDQHWVLIVGKDGDDYRVNDPWLWPAQEASLQARYGRAGRPLQAAIMSAVFYRSTAVDKSPVIDRSPGKEEVLHRLETGMNVNPDAPHSNPFQNDDLKGLDWVRMVFKLDARVNEGERGNIRRAFAQYDPIVRGYNKMGIKTLFVINQETIWGNAPWTGTGDWRRYARDLAQTAGRIARRYRRYGDKVAYQIWNEGDKRNNPASVFVEPEEFAIILQETAVAIRAASPKSPLVFGGLATGPEESIAYLNRCNVALDGPWPVDAIGIHPYTRWATRAPFDWGQHYGTLGAAFEKYRAAFPEMKFWITEIGVADDNEIGSQFYPEIADYMKDVYTHVADRYADLVPVLIWFAWSDWMRNAGIVEKNGERKPHVYAAFRAVRNRELKA